MRLAAPLLGLLLASCATGTPASHTLTAAVAASLGSNNAHFSQALVNLNNDAWPDAIVLVRDSRWCGSGGCTLLVFRGAPSGYSIVSRSTVTAPPILTLPSTHFGWRDLVVHSNSVGDVSLQFNGSAYPQNPSLEPVATPGQLQSGQMIMGPAPNNSFKPNPLRSFKTPCWFLGGSA
jgi:hypothetical protein